MKLTNYHRQAFVSSVMNDVPKHDYSSDFAKLVSEDMRSSASKSLRDALNNKELAHLILTGNDSFRADAVHVENCRYSGYEVGVSSVVTYKGYKPSELAKGKFNELMTAAAMQKRALSELENKVTGVIGSCSTLKKAHELLPEFAKYLPAEEVKGTMLPAIANLAADLMKMGWPKDAVTA